MSQKKRKEIFVHLDPHFQHIQSYSLFELNILALSSYTIHFRLHLSLEGERGRERKGGRRDGEGKKDVKEGKVDD